MRGRISDNVNQDWQLIKGADATTTALSKFDAAAAYGVIFDDAGRATTIVIAQDVTRAAQAAAPQLLDPKAGLPPAFALEGEASVRDLQRADVIKLFKQLLAAGSNGALVYDQQQVVGVLTNDQIAGYLDETIPGWRLNPAAGFKTFAGDNQLAGIPDTGKIHEQCHYPDCGDFNYLNFIGEQVVCHNFKHLTKHIHQSS